MDHDKIDAALRFMAELRQMLLECRDLKSTEEVEKQLLKTMKQIDDYLSEKS